MPFLPRRSEQPDPRPPARGLGNLFNITGAVGPEAENARDNVIRAQILLGQTGDLDLDSLRGPTGWPGSELTRGLKRYQRRKGLTVDGLMLPGGETINALQDDLYDRLAGYRAPTTAEVDGFHDRLARYRDDGSDEVEPPRMELERPDDEMPPYTPTVVRDGDRPRIEALPRGEVRRDIDIDAAPEFTPGAQVAQLAEGMMMTQAQTAANTAAAGAAGTAGAASTSKKLPPGVTPDVDKAGQQLGKWFDEKVNLLSLPWQMYHALGDGTVSAPPSEPLDPTTEAASKTPPLKPSAPVVRPPEGSKAEEREPTLEELIPPEMKPWVEGLTPFDQQLARELMLIYNRRGGPETIKGNAIIVKEFLDAVRKFPALSDRLEHVGGSHSPDKDGSPGDTAEGTYRKELYYLKPDAEGQKNGGSWADITFKAKPDLAKELGIEYLHLSSAKLLKDGKTAVSDERKKKTKLEKNHPESRVEIVEKPVVRVDGRKIPYDWESYQARIRDFVERLAKEIDDMRMQTKP